jgi:hypothetical protein
VLAIGRRQVVVFRTVLLEEGVLGEIGSVTAGGKDDGTIGRLSLSVHIILNTDDRTRVVLYELGDASLLDNLNTVGVADGKILKAFELGIGDNLRENV